MARIRLSAAVVCQVFQNQKTNGRIFCEGFCIFAFRLVSFSLASFARVNGTFEICLKKRSD